MKIHESELKIMEFLWQQGESTAKNLSILAEKEHGWNKNTTYTVIKKLVDKGAIIRSEPNFICSPAIQKEDAQISELNQIIDKFWNGSKKSFFSAFAKEASLPQDQIDELLKQIEEDDN